MDLFSIDGIIFWEQKLADRGQCSTPKHSSNASVVSIRGVPDALLIDLHTSGHHIWPLQELE